jgi:hypothetical protein
VPQVLLWSAVGVMDITRALCPYCKDFPQHPDMQDGWCGQCDPSTGYPVANQNGQAANARISRVVEARNLGISTLGELLAAEAEAPEPRFLVDPFLQSDDYGTYAAKPKVGKTWFASDLAISGATGTPLFGALSVPSIDVLLFAGEGGRRRVLRRLDAIARARSIELGDVERLRVSLKAPVVGDAEVRRLISQELESRPADLIIGEPFYLMGRGVGRGQLNEIGAVLGACQEIAQDAGATLLLGDHWNKGGVGIGTDRITGSGMQEWSRVLINGIVEDSRLDLEARSTTVDIRWDVSGEMPDYGFKIRRTVRPEDPLDPSSRLVYDVVFQGVHDPLTTSSLSEDAMRLLMELRGRKASQELPARSNEVRGSSGIDSRLAAEAWAELVNANKIDHTERKPGKSFDVWLTEEDE